MSSRLVALLGLAASTLGGCHAPGGDSGADSVVDSAGDTAPDDTYPYRLLSTWGLFDGPLADQQPAADVVPYDVAIRLWSDGADKDRFFRLPAGQGITVQGVDDWTFPEGSVLVKTFSFDLAEGDDATRVRLETRLLVLVDGAWEGLIYRWNDEQTEANFLVAGERVEMARTDLDGVAYDQEYLVPNQNQCETCHRRDDVMHPLGPMTRQMNRVVDRDGQSVNQVDWLASLGVFAVDPGPGASLDAFVDAFDPAQDLDARARGYLHANCSHCHRVGGYSGNSGLYLQAEETDREHMGICKVSAAAGAGTGGYTYDIVPGDPDHSILAYRMDSVDPEIKMPELPNLLPDYEGIALVREWISNMEGSCDP